MSEFVLRYYQERAVEDGVRFILDPKAENGIEILPCGAGKSLVIAAIAKRLDKPCLVFQPSKELLEQNKNKMEAFGIHPAVFSASFGKKEIGNITLATIGSVKNHQNLFKEFKYIMTDECHCVCAKSGMYADFFAALDGHKSLGFTATPFRLTHDGYGGSILKFLTRTRPRVFHKVVHVVQNGDLFRAGYLAKIEYKVVKTGFNRGRLRLNSTGADYTDESVRNHFKELNFSDQIVRCVNRLFELKRGNSIVFTRFVEEAEYVASKIPGAAVITTKSGSRERDNIVSAFKAGRIPCVCNVGVLGIGFDYPELKNVILARPTMSLAVYYQQVGRCVRTHPSKDCAFVVDMVGLSEQFGKVEDLTVVEGEHEKWFIESNGKQLTNVYYGERRRRQW